MMEDSAIAHEDPHVLRCAICPKEEHIILLQLIHGWGFVEALVGETREDSGGKVVRFFITVVIPDRDVVGLAEVVPNEGEAILLSPTPDTTLKRIVVGWWDILGPQVAGEVKEALGNQGFIGIHLIGL